MKPAAKRFMVLVAFLVGIAAATAGSFYLSGVLFLLFNKQSPAPARLTSITTYWKAYKHEPKLAKKLKGSIAAAGVFCFLVVPFGIYFATRERRSINGNARFARWPEVEKAGLVLKGGEKAILIGKFRDKFVGVTAQEFCFLTAPTGGGKGVGSIIPNLLNWPDSVLCNDIKEDNWNLTAGYRAECGQRVYKFAPFDPEGRTHRFNVLGFLDPNSPQVVADVIGISTVFYPDSKTGDGSAQFFNDQARNLFLAFTLFLLDTPDRPRSVGEMVRQASGTPGMALKDHLTALLAKRATSSNPLRQECVDAFGRFLSTPDNTLGSILATFNAPLLLWADEMFDAATSASDFDFRNFRRKRISLYIHIPPKRIAAARLLINLMATQFVEQNMDVLPKNDKTIKYQALAVLDELPALGRVAKLVDAVAYLREYGVRLLSIGQSQSQYIEHYGEHAARTYRTNHSAKVLFTPQELPDAEEYSKLLGFYDEKSESKSRSSGGKGGSSGTNTSPAKRALLLPQELRQMPFEECILDYPGLQPVKLEKIIYWQDEIFTSRLRPAPIVKPLNLAIHRAKVKGAVRWLSSTDDPSLVTPEVLCGIGAPLPSIGQGTPAQIRDFVEAAFARFSVQPITNQMSAA